jgi:hypothetical protein
LRVAIKNEEAPMANRQLRISDSLQTRVIDLVDKMRGVDVTPDEMKAFQKVASVLGGDGSLQLKADDLIAASFAAETLFGDEPKAL